MWCDSLPTLHIAQEMNQFKCHVIHHALSPAVGLCVVVCQLPFQEKIQEKRSQPTVASWQYLLVRDHTLCMLWLEHMPEGTQPPVG